MPRRACSAAPGRSRIRPIGAAQEQQKFAEAIGGADEITFQADKDVSAGLRITADQATLDATPNGLLADTRTIAALLLDELTKGVPA